MRFKMRFEGEDSPERRYVRHIFLVAGFHGCFKMFLNSCGDCLIRFTGTIVGVGDISPEWSGSIWRSLKVDYSCGILM